MTEAEFTEKYATHIRIRKAIDIRNRLHALVCLQTGRIFAISNSTNTVRVLSTILNTGVTPSCNKKNNNSWIDGIDADNCIYYRYLFAGKIEATNFTNFEDYHKALLINEKAAALDRLNLQIEFMRKNQQNDIYLQDVVYQEKVREAWHYKQTGNADDLIFLPTYAQSENISLADAAERIVLMRKFQLSMLNETEAIRIRYTKEIMAETDFFNLPNVISEFIKEAYAYGVL